MDTIGSKKRWHCLCRPVSKKQDVADYQGNIIIYKYNELYYITGRPMPTWDGAAEAILNGR
jgi:hypothetical protein